MAVQILRDEPITTREALIPFSVAGINILAATAAAYDALTPQARGGAARPFLHRKDGLRQIIKPHCHASRRSQGESPAKRISA